MPPLCLHMSIAYEAAGLLHSPTIDRHRGSYFIGATSPDVHIIASTRREDTHFFGLDDESPESCAGLLATHPHLAAVDKLDAATRSFVAGYLSHLTTDEVWIMDVYRPCFGTASPLGGASMANMLDRALQFELDRREREDREKMRAIRDAIAGWEPSPSIDLVEPDIMREWRDFIITATTREPVWDIFRLFAERFLLSRHKLDADELEGFLDAMPAPLEWAIQYVTAERLDTFRRRSVAQSVERAREYLGEDSERT